MHAAAKGHKRAIEAGASGSSQSRAPITTRPQFRPPAPKFRPPPPKAQNGRPQKMFCKAFTIALPKGNGGQGSSIGSRSNQPCFNCNQVGHWAKECPIPRRMAIRIRTIRGRRTQGHVLDTCIIQLLRKCPQEKLSQLVCFLSTSIPLLFYLIRELLIHL